MIKRKRVWLGILVAVILNFILIFSSVKSGIGKDDIMFRFRERQAVTMVSALFLNMTALVSLVVYLLKMKVEPKTVKQTFWWLSALGFFYLCMDEYFMLHEGMDEAVGLALLGKNIHEHNLDNLVIAFYGLVAGWVCFKSWKAIARHQEMLPHLFIGGLCLIGTIIFHSLERIDIVYEVVEESFKVVGVTFFFLAYWAAFLFTLDETSVLIRRPTD